MGTIAAEHVLVPNFGIYGGMVVVGILQAIVACLAAMTVMTRWSWRLLLLLPGAIAMFCCVMLGQRVGNLAYISPHTTFKYKVVETRFGKDGVCCVVKTQTGAKGIMVNNQYVLGTTGVIDAQRRQVLIPLLLHDATQQRTEADQGVEVCCLGLATGISAGGAMDYNKSCRVTAVELSPMVIDVAKDHFSVENRNLAFDKRASIIQEDARTYIASVRNKFDVIAGDLYRPYGSGEGRLFSVEHFRNVKNALRPGGVYCQWIPAYQVTEGHFNIIAATFLRAFPDAVLLCPDSESKSPILGLLGTKQADINWVQLEARCREFAARSDVDDQVMKADGFSKSLYIAQLSPDQFANVPINTLENATIEIAAGLHRTTYDRKSNGNSNDQSYLTGATWRAFLNKMRASQ